MLPNWNIFAALWVSIRVAKESNQSRTKNNNKNQMNDKGFMIKHSRHCSLFGLSSFPSIAIVMQLPMPLQSGPTPHWELAQAINLSSSPLQLRDLYLNCFHLSRRCGLWNGCTRLVVVDLSTAECTNWKITTWPCQRVHHQMVNLKRIIANT